MTDSSLPSVEELLARAAEDPRLPELLLRAEDLLDLDPKELAGSLTKRFDRQSALGDPPRRGEPLA